MIFFLDAVDLPTVQCGLIESSEVVLRLMPRPVTRHHLLVASVDRVIVSGPVQGAGPRVRELALPLVPGEGGLNDLGPEAFVTHVSHFITELGDGISKDRPR